MEQITLRAYAKINPALAVIGKRPDGYHDLKMIMQTVTLADEVLVKKINKPNYLKLVSNNPRLPVNMKNIAFKAAKIMIDKFSIGPGIFIDLKKNIPVSAGLAGGSADAAATLIAINTLFRLDISVGELMEIGLTLGADVPFSILKGTALAEGVGEKLTSIPLCKQSEVLIATPSVFVSTANIFSRYLPLNADRDFETMIEALKSGDITMFSQNMFNDLSTVTEKLHPEIGEIKKIMLEYGALGAQMSGSGPSVFGYFDNRGVAEEALTALEQSKILLRKLTICNTFP